MNKKFKIIILCVVAVMAVGGLVFAQTRPFHVDVVVAARESMELTFTEDGTITAAEDYDVFSPVAGKVLQVYAAKDDQVKKDQVIAEIDSKEYQLAIEMHKSNISGYQAKINESRSLEVNTKDTYQANLAKLTSQLAQVEAEMKTSDVLNASSASTLPEEQLRALEVSIAQGEVELDYNQELYDKYKSLYDTGSISEADFNSYDQKLKESKSNMTKLLNQKQSITNELARLTEKYGANVSMDALSEEGRKEQYTAAVNQIKAQISEMEKNLGKDYKSDSISYYNALIKAEETSIQTIEAKLSDCVIKAPESGIITDIPVKTMSEVYAQSLLFRMRQEANKVVESYVSTEDVPSLKVGDKVVLVQKTRTGDVNYQGTISNISSWADEKVSALGVVEQKVKVFITPNEEMPTAGSGYGLSIRYTTFKGDDLLTVPTSTLFKVNGEDALFVVENGALKTVIVKKGSYSSESAVITEGIDEGAVIVKNPSTKGIKEGMAVSY